MNIISVSFDRDVEYEEYEYRKFSTTHELNICIVTDKGVKRVRLDAGWRWNGRSGPSFIDYLSPNLGTQNEIKTYLVHDLAFSTLLGLSFRESNELMYTMLRIKCKYSYWRAMPIYAGVKFFGKKHYGEYIITDWDYLNKYKTHVEYGDR